MYRGRHVIGFVENFRVRTTPDAVLPCNIIEAVIYRIYDR